MIISSLLICHPKFCRSIVTPYDLERNPYSEWYFPGDRSYRPPVENVNVGHRVITQGLPTLFTIMDSDSEQFRNYGLKYIGKSIANSSGLSSSDERFLIRAHAKKIGAAYAMCYRQHSHTSQHQTRIVLPAPRQTIKIDTRGHVFDGNFTFFNADTIVTLPQKYNTYTIPYKLKHYQSFVMYWSR